MSEKEQEVIALVDGDEEAIADFKTLVETRKPEHSEVSKVAFEDYQGDIMRTGEYAQVCSALQLNKAIPLLLDIRDDMKELKSDMKAVRKNTDVIPQMKANTDFIPQMKANTDFIPQMKANTDAIPLVLEEIKGMREDIQPGYAVQFRQVQTDVRAIKERLGMH